MTIYATYASLPVLAEAFEGVYGQQLAPVDLTVVDEAHRTSGSMGKAWTEIHDQTIIPARRRLYLTATPRIWQERPPPWEVAEGARDALPQEMAASMDDEKVFDPVLYKLSLASAVSRALLARYQIIVLELQDPVVTPERLMGEDRRSEDVGKWLARQRKPEVWAALADGQRELLEAVGVVPLAPEPEAPAKPSTAAVSAVERGVAALAQHKARTGSLTVPRGHVETIMVDGQEHSVKLGVFLSNTKTRRAKLTTNKLTALAALGLDWAAA
ncbi:hypothetical protein [Streptomyces sp. NPDC056190]|uniref:helicase associated domain-containing protein n=1 Tax=unclassified Streptomyces TaxID=2593676 RepID=UPI0035DACA68